MSQVPLKGITARVFDVSSGRGAAGVPVRLERHQNGKWHPVAIGITGEAGRAHLLSEDDDTALERDDYRLTFEVAAYFKSHKSAAAFPFIGVAFSVAETKHHHISLTLGAFGYAVSVES